ncbi:MAG: chemotaxis protein CheX [Deltaproteobacteria bacterium]|nr:chemotaxis protein CheX [Deltaproteobacteria bacterium]
MPLPLKKILTDVTSEVLETMFFALPEPLLDSDLREPQITFDIRGSISLGGPQRLQLNLFLPKRMAAELSANLLAIEPDEVDDEALLDTVRELTNMIAGNLINRIGEDAGFEMGIPETSFGRATLPSSAVTEGQNVFIMIEEKLLMLTIRQEGP